MNNDDLEKTKSLSDLSDLIAKGTEDVLPKNNDTLEDDILKNLKETKEDVYNDLITHDIELAARTKEMEDSKEPKKENLIDKFKKLPKKTKALIIGLILLLVILAVVVVVIVLTHKKPQDEPTPEEPSIVIDNGQGDTSGIVADLYSKVQAAVKKMEQRCNFVPGSINVQYSSKQGLAGILFQTPSRIISPSFAWNAQSAAQLSDLNSEQMETQLGLDYVLGAFGETLDNLAAGIRDNQEKLDQASLEPINTDLAYNFERITKLSQTYADLDPALKEMMGEDYDERKLCDYLTTAMQVDDNDAAYQADGLLIRATYAQIFALYRLMHDSKLLEPKATTLVDLLQYQPEHPIKFEVVKDVDLFENDHDDE